MSLISSLSPANGAVPLNEPRSPSELEREIVGMPLTLGYKASLPLWTWNNFFLGHVTAFIWQDIEAMLMHPHVSEVFEQYKSGCHHAEFAVKANSPEVQRFVEAMLRRCWNRALDQFQLSYDYGWCGYEVMYAMEQGYLTFTGVLEFSPFDAWVLTRDSHYAGISVANVPGKGKIALWGSAKWPAKGMWLAVNKRWSRWYGRSCLFRAWRPWRRLAHRSGMEEVIDGAWYRFGYRGPIIRYPMKAFPRRGTTPGANTGDGGADFDRAREDARQWVENVQAGTGLVLPNSWNVTANRYEWEVENVDPAPIQLGGMLDLVKYIKNEISYGVGVPPELLEAAEPGGWSGRKVPLIVFYTRQLRNARAILWAFRQQVLDPLVRWNFGPGAKYEVEPLIKVPSELEPIGQRGAPGQPGGGAPPPGAAPEGGAPMPFAGQPQPPKNGPPTGAPPSLMSTKHDDEWLENTEVDMILAAMDGNRSAQALLAGEVDIGQLISPQSDYPEEPLWMDEVTRPVPESLPSPEPEIGWTDILLRHAPHTRIVGPSGAGKTTIAQVLAAMAPGKITIIDPVWSAETWGGLPAATVDDNGGYDQIRSALLGLLEEMRKRSVELREGKKEHDFEPLWIIWDEVPNTVGELPRLAGKVLKRLSNFGRHVGIHLIGMGQSETVRNWGLEGSGDTAENFASVFLGQKAVNRMPELAGVDHPAVLEWQGILRPFSMAGMREMGEVEAQRILASHPDKIFQLPAGQAGDKPSDDVAAMSNEALLAELAKEQGT